MKKLILFLLLLPILATSQNEWLIGKTIENSRTYKARWLPDLGALRSDNISKAFYAMSKQNGMADNIKFAWLGESATKTRVSGVYNFATKLYSTVGTNDATQTTELNQPYLAGNIAPNERYALNNPNGSSKFITHTTISFAANEAWSWSGVVSFNSSNLVASYYLWNGAVDKSAISFRTSNSNQIRFHNEDMVATTGIGGGLNSYIGKNTILTLSADGTGNLKIYINGTLHQSSAIATNIIFSRFLVGRSSFEFFGKLYAHIIRSGALSQSQVTNEYNFFRSIYPEIETVKIGNQEWATSNLDMVANTLGTVIPDGNVQATWIGGTSFWCYHTDAATGVIYGKLYNKAARNVIITSPPSGYHVSTEAELTALALYGGYKLKKEGSNYWTTANGTNSTGFTAIGGSSRNADGTFNTIKNTASFWCADSDKVLLLNHADNSATITAATANQGHSIRLVKN